MPGLSTTKPWNELWQSYVADPIELFKQFSDNESFRRWLSEMVFATTYLTPTTPANTFGDKG